MDCLDHYQKILDCLTQPAFLLSGATIVRQNTAADAAKDALTAILQDAMIQTPSVVCSGAWNFTFRPMDDLILVFASESAQLDPSSQAIGALRLPLADVFSSADALMPTVEETEDPALRKQAARMKQGLYRLHRAISHMDYLCSDPPGVRLSKLDLCCVLQAIKDYLPDPCNKNGVAVQLELPPRSVFINGDQQLLERVILNLLSNALQHTEPNSTVTISVTKQNDRALLTVFNVGKPANPGLLFGSSTDGWMQGTAGIGLALARKLTQMMRGTLLFRMLENGTAATLAFPICTDRTILLRSPTLFSDRSGGFHPVLLELSDVLPLDVFYPEALD